MLIIGLTGGIASGKTTVSNLFSNLGVPIIDTDLISRHLLDPEQPGYNKVVEYFGDEILHQDQQIDRARLRRLVFNDEANRQWLEATLHPIIYQQTMQQIEAHMFETDFQTLVNRILVIDCRSDTQIKRLIARDSIDLDLARQMLAQQWSNEDRLNQADDVIQNDNQQDADLNLQVAKLHQKYLLLAD
jgi:dephospho-CoA kinase